MTRSELYTLVWSKPSSNLAHELGCSDSWIKSVCKVHDIPTPPRGYWAKLGAGKLVAKAPLPPAHDVETGLAIEVPTPSPQPQRTTGEARPTCNPISTDSLVEARRAADIWHLNKRLDAFLAHASELADLQDAQKRSAILREVAAIRSQLQSEPSAWAGLIGENRGTREP